MKPKLCILAAACLPILAVNPLLTRAGGVFVTGHDPDFHAVVGGNTVGAQHLIQRAIEYVTFNKLNPAILLVTDLRNPGIEFSDSRLGLVASGYSTFDIADYGSGTPGVFDLHTVNFNNYDAVVVASDFGGWLREDELAILNARSAELIDFVNNGSRGIVAFAESGRLTTSQPFGFLPFLVTSTQFDQSETGISVTPAGAALGLTDSDVNGNFSHCVFTGTGGMDVIDVDSQGNSLSLATRQLITPCGINAEDHEAPLVDCRAAPNPSAKQIPTAGQNSSSGQNPDGFYELLGTDNCDVSPRLYIADSGSSFVAGPFAHGDIVKITQAPGVEPNQKPGARNVVAHIQLTGDALLYATDAVGNASAPIYCNVPPPPK